MKFRLPSLSSWAQRLPSFKNFDWRTARDSVSIDWRAAHAHVVSVERKGLYAGLALGLVAATYFGIQQTTGGPDYTISYASAEPPVGSAGGGSKTIAVMQATIEGELSNGWCPAMTIFNPHGGRTDSCGYQEGEQSLLKRAARTMVDNVAYAGTGTHQQYDHDLDEAASGIGFFSDRWAPFNGTVPVYADAANSFGRYNHRLADGKTQLMHRVSDVEELLNTVMRVTGDESNEIESTIDGSSWLTGHDREVYNRTRGAFRVACDLLQAIKIDFSKTIDNQGATDSFIIAVKATCDIADLPEPDMYYFLSSRMDSIKRDLAGRSSTATGSMANAYAALVGGANHPR